MPPHIPTGRKKFTPLQLVLVVVLVLAWKGLDLLKPHGAAADPGSGRGPVAAARAAKAESRIVEDRGIVKKLLPDDRDGDRHQKLLIECGDGTILLVHNIDLAPRIETKPGDAIAFRGEYIWNEQGGLVHWTHHDPRGRHEGGWVRVGDRTFR